MSSSIGIHATRGTIAVDIVERPTIEQGRPETLQPYHELNFRHDGVEVNFYVTPAQLSQIADALAKYQTVTDFDELWENYKASQYAREQRPTTGQLVDATP